MDIKIIALGPNSWEGPWMNRQQILSRLAVHCDIVYSEPLSTNWELKQNWHKAGWFPSFDLQNGVWIFRAPKWLVKVPKFPFISAIVEKIGAYYLQKFASKLNDRKTLVYAFRPEFWPLIKNIDPDYLVYHVYDVFDVEDDWSKQKADWQSKILARADLVITSSNEMAQRLKEQTDYSGEIHVLFNGADVESFKKNTSPCPLDIVDIPSPRMGYVGRLNKKVDFELIANLASKHSAWNFVFVGPEVYYDNAAQLQVDRCKALSNVYFLGGKAHTDLPYYVNAMDVNLLCYTIDKKSWSYFCYPLKLHECLATGKPVISAPLHAVLEYDEVVKIAETFEDWDLAITQALEGESTGTPESRVKVAEANSWDVRVENLQEKMREKSII